MSDFDLTWNTQFILDAANDSFRSVVAQLDEASQRAIQAQIWTPDKADRSDRDLVDSRELLNSREVAFTSEGEAVIEWTADHAIYAHEPTHNRDGSLRPGNPWTEKAIAEVNPTELFAREFTQRIEEQG